MINTKPNHFSMKFVSLRSLVTINLVLKNNSLLQSKVIERTVFIIYSKQHIIQ